MAESVVAQQPQRFYCHKCNVEIENVSSVSAFSDIIINEIKIHWVIAMEM